MRVETDRKLFVCLRIDNKIRDQLAHCPPRDRMYFDGSNPQYLSVLSSGVDSYIGKIVDPGSSAISMDDLKRNLLSILTKVAPGRHRDDAVKVFALDNGEPPRREEEPSAEEPDRNTYY
jgi:hypothetical protein